MKYVVTKDGRIVEVKNAWEYVIGGINVDDIFFDDGEILKRADTIEELCDEFVVVDEKCGHRIALLCGERPQGIKLYIYGAVWTDKGLIYVAKMNEKGILELL